MMNKDSIMAFVRLIVPAIAAGLSMFGIAVDADALLVGTTIVISAVTFIWSWWKNNNLTSAAQEAQKMLDEIKSKSV